MKELLIVLVLCTGTLLSPSSFAQPNTAQRRINYLKNTYDSVLVFEKNCSYCVSGMKEEALVLYKGKRKRFRVELFEWDNRSDSFERVKNKADHHLLKNIVLATNRLLGNLKKDSAPVYGVVSLDAREGFSSHGPYINLYIKFGEEYLSASSWVVRNQNSSFYLQNHYDYGKLILLLNMISAKEDYFVL
ncbi:MAG: hypothetical protein EOP52_10525 [Sphingobacteriales bacterium]|nr:MAG: hypothetical protein EOP52_10525 [Sphingobacteriales bacterium]